MAIAQFRREYRIVRRAEGWGSWDAAYYRALPYQDLTRRFVGIWRIRARSFDAFVAKVLEPLERWPRDADARRVESSMDSGGRDDGWVRRARASPARGVGAGSRHLQILDLGAGSGWLAHRLALRGHVVTALDILDDPLDGLGAARHFASAFSAVLAEFDHLPLPATCVDLVIFNASLHYSTNYACTLRESLRVLRPRGTLVILDSPMYSDPTSGTRMVLEREARFFATYGFMSNALPSEHFLTPARLDDLAGELGIDWQVHRPGLDWRSAVSRTFGGLRARREPAQFPVIAGTRR
jgi:SAM-dependent methyltransferase